MMIDLEVHILQKHQKRNINLEIIARLKSFQEALLMCKALSLLDDKALAKRLGMTTEEYIAIWNDPCNFPMNRLLDFMLICENIVPVVWLALKCGYGMKPFEDEMAQETRLLAEQVAAQTREIEIFKEEILDKLEARLIAKSGDDAEVQRMAGLVKDLRSALG